MSQFPQCLKCVIDPLRGEIRGDLLPLSDYSPQGGEVRYKAWTCSICNYVIRIDNGKVTEDRRGHYQGGPR